jgi:GTP cyclohydrolase I
MEAVTNLDGVARLRLEPRDGSGTSADLDDRGVALAELTRRLLETIGEDPLRDGLLRTPERVARAWRFLTGGYDLVLSDVANGALFPAESSQLVVVRDIEFHSLCEHHLLPFLGRVHVGYAPRASVLGLSKFARIAEMFSRRLQVQERLTSQIAAGVMDMLDAHGVGVVVDAEHLCMTMRGVQKSGAVTTTSCLLGTLRDVPAARDEFLGALGMSRSGVPRR